jgi:hypothetical protein
MYHAYEKRRKINKIVFAMKPERGRLENPTISKPILETENVRVWNAFMWLKTGANVRLL